MKIFLAGTNTRQSLFENNKPRYILESFYYIENWQIKKIQELDMFLLDSGAFTFMNAGYGSNNFDEYLGQYINFIRSNNIQYFFELDLDSIIGYNRVQEMTKRLEEETGRKCIPVWHKSRGLENFIETTIQYNYIAIGGIVNKEIKKNEYKYLKELIRISHMNDCKIHGLGFTNTGLLREYKFDSVDSTSWLSGSRFGKLQYFNGKKMVIVKKPENKRTVDYKKIDDFNFKEWIKFQEYARKNL